MSTKFDARRDGASVSFWQRARLMHLEAALGDVFDRHPELLWIKIIAWDSGNAHLIDLQTTESEGRGELLKALDGALRSLPGDELHATLVQWAGATPPVGVYYSRDGFAL